MKGAIVEKKGLVHTDLLKLFRELDGFQNEYNWLISDIMCYPSNDEFRALCKKEYIWISGKELTKILETENFQWIWGVFSGFEEKVSKKYILEDDLPFANGNANIWQLPLSLQHSLAEVEIVAWDSEATILLSKNDSIVEKFMEKYTNSEDLEEYLMRLESVNDE